MKTVKSTDQYTVYQKRSGRYAVESAKGAPINEEEKVKILLAEGLIVVAEAKAEEPEAAVEEAEAAPEATAEEKPAEEEPSE